MKSDKAVRLVGASAADGGLFSAELCVWLQDSPLTVVPRLLHVRRPKMRFFLSADSCWVFCRRLRSLLWCCVLCFRLSTSDYVLWVELCCSLRLSPNELLSYIAREEYLRISPTSVPSDCLPFIDIKPISSIWCCCDLPTGWGYRSCLATLEPWGWCSNAFWCAFMVGDSIQLGTTLWQDHKYLQRVISISDGEQNRARNPAASRTESKARPPSAGCSLFVLVCWKHQSTWVHHILAKCASDATLELAVRSGW